MFRRIAIVSCAFILVSACLFGAVSLADESVGLPKPIVAESPCPAVGCANGECHGFDDVPEPDGVHELTCPEESCSSKECHAWQTLSNRYHQASDMSLNVWLMVPAILACIGIIVVRKAR